MKKVTYKLRAYANDLDLVHQDPQNGDEHLMKKLKHWQSRRL